MLVVMGRWVKNLPLVMYRAREVVLLELSCKSVTVTGGFAGGSLAKEANMSEYPSHRLR